MAARWPAVGPPPVPPSSRRDRCALPCEAASVPEARRFVRQVLRRWRREEYEEAGVLLVSELVTNAVLHARSDVDVEVVDAPAGVLVAVTDGSASMLVRRRHSRDAGTGRGLWLLEQYSSAHGIDVTRPDGGKTVWVVLCPDVRDPGEGMDAALARWLDQVEGS